MLKIISYISVGFAGVFFLFFLVYLFQRTRKKGLKVRKKIRLLRRVYGCITLLFLITAGILYSFGSREAVTPADLLSDASPVDAYKKMTGSNSYRGLPTDLYAAGDDYYVKTGTKNLYGYVATESETTAADGTTIKSVTYNKGLALKNALSAAGGKGLIATLSARGTLLLNGNFEYRTYENAVEAFYQKVYSRKASFMDATSNNLFYVEKGDLYSVGYNIFAQLGDSTERSRITSSKILSGVSAVSVSDTHVLAVDQFGNLYGFGDNTYSEMGNQTTAANIKPGKIFSGVKQAEAGRYFSIVLAKNGDVYVAGRNNLGQLGSGDKREYAVFTKVLEGIEKISVSGNSCAALTAGGKLYVWGDNRNGQLALNEETVGAPAAVRDDVYDMAMGEKSMAIITLNRDVYVTGNARGAESEEAFLAVYEFGAKVPEQEVYRYTASLPVNPEK